MTGELISETTLASYRRSIAKCRSTAARGAASHHAATVSVDASVLENLCDLAEQKAKLIEDAQVKHDALRAILSRSTSPQIRQIALAAINGNTIKGVSGRTAGRKRDVDKQEWLTEDLAEFRKKEGRNGSSGISEQLRCFSV